MRTPALKKAGFLQADYHMVLDHALWIRIARQGPILHVPETWAVERTHETAKTIAQATVFVDEAFRLIPALEKDPVYQQSFANHHNRIWGGLHLFATRRYLDSGNYRQALHHYFKGLSLYPRGCLGVPQIYPALGSIGLMGHSLHSGAAATDTVSRINWRRCCRGTLG
jgi:hypothetical protein